MSVWHDCTGLLALETGKLGSVHVGVLARLHAMLGEEKKAMMEEAHNPAACRGEACIRTFSS